MEPSLDQPKTKRKISRRDFLKLAGAGLLLAAGADLVIVYTKDQKERERGGKVAVLDMFDIRGQNTIDFDGDTKQIINNSFGNEYGGHGETVSAVMNKLKFNTNEPQEQISIVSAVKIGEEAIDKVGNKTVNLEITEKEIIKLIGQTESGTINMSFEVGKIPVTIVTKQEKLKNPSAPLPGITRIGSTEIYKDELGNKISIDKFNEMRRIASEKIIVDAPENKRVVVFLDGYAGENTYDNLLAMTNIAAKFPDKTFIVAGGNPKYLNGLHTPDIREARVRLEKANLWPENLIVVGFQYHGDGIVAPASLGADIYVSDKDLEEMGFFGASSFATPVITEIVSALKKSGVKNWKDILLDGLTENNEFWNNNEKIDYKVLNLGKSKELLLTGRL